LAAPATTRPTDPPIAITGPKPGHSIVKQDQDFLFSIRTQSKLATTTMATPGESQDSRKPSNSRSRTSRPTTPLRPSSRSSFRESARTSAGSDAPFPLNAFEPAFAEFSDAMADLEANLMHFQLMHESLARFGESFASFIYGLNMNAFCVDFPEVCY
jgi:DASH complex subunit DAM1